MSRPYPVAPPSRQKIPVCEVPIPTSIKKAVPFFNAREFWSWGANPVGSNCRQLDTIIEKPTPPVPLNVCTYAGFGGAGDDDGIVNLASFAFPIGIAADASGNVYVADSGNHKIKKIDTSGFVTTFAGTGVSGFTNGTSLSASFWNPTGVVVSSNGNVYVADSLNNSIRKISNGVVTTLAGNATAGFVDGTGNSASFNFPFDLTLDLSENLYIADSSNDSIRFCTAAGVVTRYAGQYTGFRDGNRLAITGAQFNKPTSVAFNLSTGELYVTDTTNNAIRVISGDNVSTALINYYAPVGGSFDSLQNYYFTEQGFNRIIKYSLSNGTNVIFAGDGTEGFQNGLDLSSSFAFPFKVCAISPSLAYVADNENNVIRRISSFVTPITEILNADSISPYQYSSSNVANLTYSIIGGGGGGAVGISGGGGGGAGAQYIDGYISDISPGSSFDFLVGRKGTGGLGFPSYSIPTSGKNTILTINGQTITSLGASNATQILTSEIGGNGANGIYGGGGGFGTASLGIGGSGEIDSGKKAYNSNGGNGGGIAAGVGGAYVNASGLSVGSGGGGGGHGGGYGKFNFCNAFYYGAGGGGINTVDQSGNRLDIQAGNGFDGVIALVFTPI